MKTKLEMMIRNAVEELFGITGLQIALDHPELSHGDYATNAALVVAKKVNKTPLAVAEELVTYLDSKKNDLIESVTVAGPGFINFKISQIYTAAILSDIFEQREEWGKSSMYADKSALIEHSSPNLFKPFHIGHVMNNTIGESIVRLAKFSGAEVHAISYPSDISLGIGKAVRIMLRDGREKLEALQTVEEQIAYLGDCYVRGTQQFEADESVQKEVREITKKLYEKTPSTELELYEIGKKINLEYFLGAVKRLGSYFDGGFIFESEAEETGAKIVRDNTPGIFEQSEGAIVYRGEQDGLHTRVFINKEGFATYEGKDIGLLSLKFAKFNPDLSIFITDHQQTSHFDVVLAAAAKIDETWKARSVHRTHGRMSFKGQKMSSRLGGVPTAKEVIDTLGEEIKERSADLSSDVQDMISIGALKFVILRTMAGKDINFDPETSLSLEGDSGPYLQYTAVRAASVIAKAETLSLYPKVSAQPVTDVERLIQRFPDIVSRSIAEWAPHHIVSYLLELAQAFNSWYGNTKIIDEADQAGSEHRLAITAALAQTITNGLWLLGISVPEKM